MHEQLALRATELDGITYRKRKKNSLKIKSELEKIGLKTRLEEGKSLQVAEIRRERVPDFRSRG